MNKEKGVQMILANVPEKLRRSFKAACITKGITMREAVLEFMEGYVKSSGSAATARN
jgi:hypothetical protein